jgi:hypothetical protein
MNILLFVAIAFIGYLIGRVGDKVGGHWNLPHHWIYGLILIILGLVFYSNYWCNLGLYFGIGLFVSDGKDFLKMKVYGPDEGESRSFWGFD